MSKHTSKENRLDYMFVYPDPLTSVSMITGAAFLYFDKPLLFSTPPMVITPEAFKMLDLVKERKPKWSVFLHNLLGMWTKQRHDFEQTINLLSPLKGKKYEVGMTSYAANELAMEESASYIESAGMSLSEAAVCMELENAAGEFVRSIFLEAYLDNEKELEKLYQHCESILGVPEREVIEHLAKCYFLRIPMAGALKKAGSRVLFTNQKILPLLESLPIESAFQKHDWTDSQDLIAWELFRRIVSPHIDPLDNERVESITTIIENRSECIRSLRDKCSSLSYDVKFSVEQSSIDRDIERLVRSAKKEISDLLLLDKRTLEEFIDSIFADEKTWLFFSGFITGLLNGGLTLTAGAAIASFSNVGAKAYKSASERNRKLKSNDYSLIYFINNP